MRFIFLILLFVFVYQSSSAQITTYNFRHVSTKDGMNDGVVGPIVQDKYGYLWFGTTAGLNRYDGYKVTSFIYNYRDSFSIPSEVVRTMFCDKNGDIWFGYSGGLYRFDYHAQNFELIPSTKGTVINEIRQGEDANILFLLTTSGLAAFNTSTNTFALCTSKNDEWLIRRSMYEGHVYKSSVYICSDTGVVVYNSIEKTIKVLRLSPDHKIQAERVVIDSTGRVWTTAYHDGPVIYKGIKNNSEFEEITTHRFGKEGSFDHILDMHVDPKNRLWIATIWNGLIKINTEDNSYNYIVNDQRIPNSLPENHITKIYSDKQGFMWLGSEGSGVAYFQPDYNLFHIFFPEPLKNLRPHIWTRAIEEDKQGNLWMGTGLGLVQQFAGTNQYKIFERKEIVGKESLYASSIRALLSDDENNMWIGTSMGLNMYETAKKKMHFFDLKDSLPQAFYWTIMQDSKKTIWLGCNRGLFYKLPGALKFYTLLSHPVLKPYVGYGIRSMLEDSRGNIWFGLNGKGLILFDTKKQTATYWKELGPPTSPLGKIITSITEDKKGIIWFSSYYGIASYNYASEKFTPYSDIENMESLQISSLSIDSCDRLWMASSKGLLMLDRERKDFKHFNAEDGLPDIQFNDQGAFKLRNGQFVYPTYDGFVMFEPGAYQEKNISSNTIISAFTVPGYPAPTVIDIREKKEVSLLAAQNFFTIELTGFNYSNPKETWYAYQLEGFDKEWIYTKNRLANYTNVPGGNYVFRYKAFADPHNRDVPEKTLKIHVDTVFYKTWWFMITMVGLAFALVFSIYRYRITQREKLLSLESKAQLLEKEKTQVMYESLKQQLNPHFLFNSLTSLSSLIRIDSKTAGEFLDSLSKTYRYILKSSDNETVSLISEIKFVESYIKLQQTRFGKGLEVNINVDEEFHHSKIVPVTLQNMIDNAIKHNIIDEESPLQIDIYTEDSYVIIRNNLQKKNYVETSNKQGLIYLKSLYRYLSDRPVEIKEDENYFMIKIPLL